MKKTSLIIALTILALNINAQITYSLTSLEILSGIEEDDTKPFLKAVTVKYIVRAIGTKSIFVFKDINGKTVYKMKAGRRGRAQTSVEGTGRRDNLLLMCSKEGEYFMFDDIDSESRVVLYLKHNLDLNAYEYKLSFSY